MKIRNYIPIVVAVTYMSFAFSMQMQIKLNDPGADNSTGIGGEIDDLLKQKGSSFADLEKRFDGNEYAIKAWNGLTVSNVDVLKKFATAFVEDKNKFDDVFTQIENIKGNKQLDRNARKKVIMDAFGSQQQSNKPSNNGGGKQTSTGGQKPLFPITDPKYFNVGLFSAGSGEAEEFRDQVVNKIEKVWVSLVDNEKTLYVKKYRVDKVAFNNVLSEVIKLLEEHNKLDVTNQKQQRSDKLKEAKNKFKEVLPKDKKAVDELEVQFKKIAPIPSVINKPETKEDEDFEDFKEYVKNLANPLSQKSAFKNIKDLSQKYQNAGKWNIDQIANGDKLITDNNKIQDFINNLNKKPTIKPQPVVPKEFDMTPLAQALSDIK